MPCAWLDDLGFAPWGLGDRIEVSSMPASAGGRPLVPEEVEDLVEGLPRGAAGLVHEVLGEDRVRVAHDRLGVGGTVVELDGHETVAEVAREEPERSAGTLRSPWERSASTCSPSRRHRSRTTTRSSRGQSIPLRCTWSSATAWTAGRAPARRPSVVAIARA